MVESNETPRFTRDDTYHAWLYNPVILSASEESTKLTMRKVERTLAELSRVLAQKPAHHAAKHLLHY